MFRPFRTPQIGMGVGPRRALQCCSSSWFGRPRRRWPRRRRPRRRRRSVPPHTEWMRSPSHCERHDAHALSGDIRLIHTRARCVGPPPCDCACACVWWGDGGDRVRVHIAVVAGSTDSTARSAMGSGGQCAVGNHMCTHERTSMGTRENKLTQAVVPSVAGCGGLHMSVVYPTRRAHAADARRPRVSHRAPALRPHRTDQI